MRGFWRGTAPGRCVCTECLDGGRMAESTVIVGASVQAPDEQLDEVIQI